MRQFTNFVMENIAPPEATKILVYDENGGRVGSFGLGSLAFPDLGTKLYSFGALSDVHVSSEVDTSEADFRRALTYFQDTEKVNFVCIAGDLTQYSYDAEWTLYKKCISEESEKTPVYAVAGNHDCYGRTVTDAWLKTQTGYGTFYTFTQGNDVFIMLSSGAYPSQSGNLPPFYTGGLQQLYNTLETNRNKRCFVFQHYFMVGYSGDPTNAYGSTTIFGNQQTVLQSLMSHYPNAIWFHGHSHLEFESQLIHDKTTYDKDFGCHSIHIPSCAVPKVLSNGSSSVDAAGSQGYVVDVYNNAIVLKGRDFIANDYIPLGVYCLDTTLKTVAAGTYTDSTGTITV